MPACCSGAGEAFDFLTTDPQTVGVVTWVSLVVTVAGFWIAIAQLRRVKTSSQAAAEAVSGLTNVVRSHEQSAKITSAQGNLTLAHAMMKQGNAEATAAHLLNAWNELVAAYELTADRADREAIGAFVLSTRQLFDDFNAPTRNRSVPAKVMDQRHAEISKTLGGLGSLSARLNAELLGIGRRS